MVDYSRLLRNLFVDWFQKEVTPFLEASQTFQITRGPVSTQDVGRLLQEVMATSQSEYHRVPIDVSLDRDLHDHALRQLVIHLPWDVVNQKMDMNKLKKSGYGVNAALSNAVAQLVQADAKLGLSDHRSRQLKLELIKDLKLSELSQIEDVIDLFFEWQQRAGLNDPWKAAFFYLQVPALTGNQSIATFGKFLNDLALEVQKRAFAIIIADSTIDFKAITTRIDVMEYRLRFNYDRISAEVIELARNKASEWSRFEKLRSWKTSRLLNKFLSDTRKQQELSGVIKRNGYSLASWDR